MEPESIFEKSIYQLKFFFYYANLAGIAAESLITLTMASW